MIAHTLVPISFVVIRSKSDADATVRLQTDAILRGARSFPEIEARHIIPGPDAAVPAEACVLFHFDEAAVIALLQKARQAAVPFTAISFGSDIYRFERYLAADAVADIHLMPTELHRKILAAQFFKPVFHLPESIDPISGFTEGALSAFPLKHSRRLLWFGYPESFEKAMASLVPVINLHRKTGCIEDFTLLLNQQEFLNTYGFPTQPFRAASFPQDVSNFDYCVLSHLPLDLSLNSFIKSPNKLLTALMAGLIPIASDTPAYGALMREFGLDRFLFESPRDLHRIFSDLQPLRDSEAVIHSGIREALAERYSDRQTVQSLLKIVTTFGAANEHTNFIELRPSLLAVAPQSQPLTFSHHLRDLAPSLGRAMRTRLQRRSS